MIHEVAHKLESDGFQIIKPIKDSDGTIAYWLRRSGENFCLVTKEYAYRGLASFMEVVVENASKNDITLIFYENCNETLTVFNADYYRKNGGLSHGKSKTRDSRWLELPLSEGCSLGDYLRGASNPQSPAENNMTLGAF